MAGEIEIAHWPELLSELTARVRLDKAIVLYSEATPPIFSLDNITVFRASAIPSMCPVESAFLVKLIKEKKEDQVRQWMRGRELTGNIVQIVDTGTVIHEQLKYYAGLVGLVREGQWRCSACGFFTHKKVAMPLVAVSDSLSGLDHSYPAPCPRCKGANLGAYPPWRYVEPDLIEKVTGVPKQFKIQGHTDGLWNVRIHLNKEWTWLKILVDYKTMNHNRFEGKYGSELPSKEHLPQLQTYLNLADVEVGLLLYYCKDNSEHKYCWVRRDRTGWAATVAKVNWARKGDMADKAKYRVCPNIGHPRSRKCVFQQACWGQKAPENVMA
jgi:hypothetical protein